MVGLDRKHAIACLAGPAADEKAPAADFFADAIQLRELHALQRGPLLDRDLRHQLIDFDEGLPFGGHDKSKK